MSRDNTTYREHLNRRFVKEVGFIVTHAQSENSVVKLDRSVIRGIGRKTDRARGRQEGVTTPKTGTFSGCVFGLKAMEPKPTAIGSGGDSCPLGSSKFCIV